MAKTFPATATVGTPSLKAHMARLVKQNAFKVTKSGKKKGKAPSRTTKGAGVD